MAVQESATRISQLLPSINCADCGQTVEFRKLGEHICKAAPAVPELPSVYKNSGKRPGNDVSGIKKQTNYSRPNIATDENLRDNRLLPRSPSPYDATPSPTDSGYSSYSSYSSKYPSPPSASSPNGNKPLLPFMQKYQQTAGKPVNSPSQTSSEQRDRLQNNFNINGNNYSSKFSSNSDNFGSEVMQKHRPHDAYGPSNENRGQRQDRYLRGPNDVYNNDRDHMYREEERSRSRSPAGYDRTNDRADYGSKISQPSLNQLNGTRDYEQLYKPTYDQQDSKPPYGYVDPGKQHSHKHSQEKNNGLPQYVPPLFEKSDKNHRKNENSLSSLNSSASGRVKYPDMNKGISDDSKELFGSGFDFLMEDLMSELDNMQTPTSGHVKNKASSGRKEVHTCAYCNLPIDSSPMWALNKSWHSYHLLCTQCHKPIDPNIGHVEKNEKVYCPNDFADLFLPKCRRCHLPVEREAVSASDGKLEGKWHVKCFNCHTCSQPFPDKSFYVFNNAPYCKWHYHKLNNSLCRTCDDPIEGPCAQTVEGWRYHPRCFVCCNCREPLTDIYYSFENKQYCEIHIMEIQRKRKIRAEKRRTLFQNI